MICDTDAAAGICIGSLQLEIIQHDVFRFELQEQGTLFFFIAVKAE